MPGLHEFSGRRRAALMWLVKHPGATAAEIAAAVHVHERTVRRWLDDDAFRAAFDREISKLFGRQVARLKLLVTKAVDTLDAALADDSLDAAGRALSWATRVRAAQCVIGSVRELDLEDVIRRIERLEEDGVGGK